MSSSNPSTPSSSQRSKQLLNRAYSSMSRATASRSREHHASSTLSQIKSNLSTNTSNSVKQAVAKGDQIEFKKVFPYPASQSKNLTQDQSGTNLSSDQQTKYDQMLQHFKEVAKEGGKGFPKGLKAPLSTQFEPPTLFENLRLLCKESLLRYLRASKWDLEVAKKRLTDTIAWRREFGVDEITADQVEEEAKCGKESVLGYDNLGRPLHMMHPHRNNTKESPRQMQFAVWILERCIDLMPPGVEQLALLINFDSRSRNPTSIANAKLMLYILQNHYVERLGVALCINVPWVFKMFWNAIQSFIDPNTKSKCKFDEAVKGEVPPQQLTTDFGGLLSFPYNEDPEVHEKYWSQLVKLCDDRRKDMERRFKEECNGEVGASEWVILGGNEKREINDDENAQEEKKDEAQSDEKAQEGSGKETNGFVALSQVNTSSTMATSAAFKTPSENISKNPLDRTFSATSGGNRSLNGDATAGISSQTVSTPAADAAEVSALETTTEKPAEEEAEIKKSFTAIPVQVNGNGHAHHEGGFSKFMHNTIKKTEESFHKLDDLVHHRNSGDHARVNGRAPASPVKSSEVNGTESKGLNGEVVAAGALAGATTAGVVEVNGHGSHDSKEPSKEEKVESTPISNDVKVLFFASSRDAAGTSQISIPIPSTDKSESDSSNLSLSKLPDLILSQLKSGPDADSNADLEQLEKLLKEKESGIRWSVNEEMVDEDQLETLVLKGGEEVAVIPPVSGG